MLWLTTQERSKRQKIIRSIESDQLLQSIIIDEENNFNLLNIGPQNNDTTSHKITELREQEEITNKNKRFKTISTAAVLQEHYEPMPENIITKTTVGVILLLIPVFSIILDPLRLVVKYGTTVKNGSFLFNVFQTEVEGARLSLYVFNITNSERFLSGVDWKLRVQEVGPFSYQEIRRNGDIELNEAAGELWFTPHMKVRFLPEESIGDPQHMKVTVPSLALMSATSLLRMYPFWIQKGFNVVAHQLGSRIISSLDAHSFLWGYNDPLIALANTIAPGLIYFDRLGIIDRLYDNNTMYRMKVGITDEDKWSIKVLRKYLRGKSLDQQKPLEDYNFTNTYEGASYPPGLTPSTPLNIYRIGVCRPLNLEYTGQKSLDYGPQAMVFKISNETFHRDCGVPQGMCGMLDLSKCTYGIPIAISRTHFLNSDPKLFDRVEGMTPDEALHDSTFVMEPKMGFELQTNLSLQLNIVLGDISFNREAKMFSNMTVPIAYIKVVQPEVFDNFKLVLKIVYVWGPNVLLSIEIIMILIGIALLAKALKLYWTNRHCDSEASLVTAVNEKQVPLLT